MADQQWSQKSRINAYVAVSATTPLETTVLDMLGFESVLFIAQSTVTSTAQSLRMLNGTASTTGAGNFSEVVGDTSHTATGGLYLDVLRPAKRFVQGQFTASGAAGTRGLVAIRYGAKSQPTTQDIAVGTLLYSPASGTATG